MGKNLYRETARDWSRLLPSLAERNSMEEAAQLPTQISQIRPTVMSAGESIPLVNRVAVRTIVHVQ